MLHDLHLHSLVSDGALDPVEVLREAHSRGVGTLSIADHDALGAYRWRGGAVFDEARRLGLSLEVGLEMDADLEGVEVHLLGYGVALDEAALTRHLETVRESRFERARLEIGLVNGLLGEGTIRPEEVFAEGRETLMKPHFIHPLLDRGLFPTYEAANAWYRRNVRSGVLVPKPSLAQAISLVHGAGGEAVLAHPGYYQKPALAFVPRLTALRALGLDGVEVDYPYHACSPGLFSEADERALVAALREAAGALGLRTTRGSDAHTRADFDRVYGPRG